VTVLGIETSTAVCGAALVRDGRVASEALLEMDRVHAERLIGQIDDVLRSGRARLADLTGLAVSIGPGSFTGLRIGVSVAKGLAYARTIPLVGVPTLEALARHACAVEGMATGTRLLAALDARRDEVYCQFFTVVDGLPQSAGDACDLTVTAVAARLSDSETVLTGTGAEKIFGAVSGLRRIRMASRQALRCSASSVALLGEMLLQAGKADDTARLEPRYIKDFFLMKR
jgi:tRNA threonylcarbamoyladenosine biosynthesis protein TsaB